MKCTYSSNSKKKFANHIYKAKSTHNILLAAISKKTAVNQQLKPVLEVKL